jgi:DNA invertase Pin-like site-specific DNA recombinase
MKRAVLYLRVSTIDQTTANQERELRQVAERMRCDVVKVYKDHAFQALRAGIGARRSMRCAGTPQNASST